MTLGDLLIFALPLLLLLWLFTRSRRQQREIALTQSTIEPGRRVMMTSGVYGDIVSVGGAGHDVNDHNTVVVELAPGVRTTWARQAVARVLPLTEPTDGPAAEPADSPVESAPADESEDPGPQRP